MAVQRVVDQSQPVYIGSIDFPDSAHVGLSKRLLHKVKQGNLNRCVTGMTL